MLAPAREALATQRTTIAEQNPWGGNRLRLKSHTMAHQAPRLPADIMDSNSTTAVAMPESIETPQDHPKFGLKPGK